MVRKTKKRPTKKRPAKKRPAKKRPGKPTKKRTRKTPKSKAVKRGRGRPLKGEEFQWVEPFLEAVTRTFHLEPACRLSDIPVNISTVRDRRTKDPEFDARVKEARKTAIDRGEYELYRRGVHGWNEPKTVAGQREEVVKYSDTCLIAFLNARRSEVYHHRVDMKAKVETTPRIDLSDLQNATNEEAMAAYRESLLQPSEN